MQFQIQLKVSENPSVLRDAENEKKLPLPAIKPGITTIFNDKL